MDAARPHPMIRCTSCGRKLCEFVEGRVVIKCRCGTVNILTGVAKIDTVRIK
jgi:phage FluMu protein Com